MKKVITELNPETTRVLPPPDDPAWNPYEKRGGTWYEIDYDGTLYEATESDVLRMINQFGFRENK